MLLHLPLMVLYFPVFSAVVQATAVAVHRSERNVPVWRMYECS